MLIPCLFFQTDQNVDQDNQPNAQRKDLRCPEPAKGQDLTVAKEFHHGPGQAIKADIEAKNEPVEGPALPCRTRRS